MFYPNLFSCLHSSDPETVSRQDLMHGMVHDPLHIGIIFLSALCRDEQRHRPLAQGDDPHVPGAAQDAPVRLRGLWKFPVQKLFDLRDRLIRRDGDLAGIV